VNAVVALLEGFEAPAGAWETELLPARIVEYESAWLDDQCLAGRVTWTRLSASAANGRERAVSPVRTTPIALLPRRHAAVWTGLAASEPPQPGQRAQAVLDCLRTHGASFFDEIAEATHLLRPQVEEALAELVALGLVNSDSFGGLRALLVPGDRRKPFGGAARRRRVLSFGMEEAGRWAPIRRGNGADGRLAAAEHVAHTLLRRYGVVFWRLLAREAPFLPPWRDLLRVYRRMEARGDIRGGRFVAGFSGEQYALPEAVGLLRQIRRREDSGEWVSLSGADPLNLCGILTPGARLAALTGNRLLFRDGVPVAVLSGGEVQFLAELDAAAQWDARKRLLRSAAPAVLADLA
jgi:ATP-dependent Lhr-like helicase